MFRVVCDFHDLTDDNRHYGPGDSFPRPGLDVAPDRIAELTGTGNRLGRPVIEEIADAPPKPATKKRVKKDA